MSKSMDSLVRLCVANHTPEELALGWLRYEALRKVSPRTFAEMNRRNLAGEFFDGIVDGIVTEVLLSLDTEMQPIKQKREMKGRVHPF
jgi:hypothetical protein